MNINHDSQQRRLKRIRSKIRQISQLPRLTVSRSLKHIWAQIIDDRHGKTLVSASTKAMTASGTKSEQAFKVGEDIGQKAIKLKITHIKFDRGLYLYHGRVKAVADGARQAGLKF